MTPITWVLLALAGGIGGVSRFLVDYWVAKHNRLSTPLGTIVVNFSACLLMGLLAGWLLHHSGNTAISTVLGTGLLGGYSTFSTASVEGARLIRSGSKAMAVLHSILMLVGCVIASLIGLWII